jgi:hypothetical protein
MTNETNKPTHYVYAVRKGSGTRGFWTRIGAAWANRDGEGFSVRLDLIPLSGADIVIRTPRDDRADAEEGGAA